MPAKTVPSKNSTLVFWHDVTKGNNYKPEKDHELRDWWCPVNDGGSKVSINVREILHNMILWEHVYFASSAFWICTAQKRHPGK